jgi:DNA polymerase-3 subunit beta
MLEALEESAQSRAVSSVATAAGAAAEAETAPEAESVYQDYGYEADVRYEEEAEEEPEEPAAPALLTVVCTCETSLEVEEGTDATCPNCGRVLDDRGIVLEGPDEEPEEEGPEEEKPKPKRSYSGNLVIEKKVLKAILDQASRYLDAKGMMPILGGVCFQANDGMLQAWATDLEIYGVIKAEAAGKGNLKFVANAKDLKDIVKKLKGNTITLIVREDKIVLTDDVVILELATMPEEDFPLIPGGNYSKVAELSMDDFRRAMAKVLPAASKDDKRPTLQGVLFNFEEGTVVATDSYRLAICETGWTAGDIQLLVPASALTQFLKLKEKSGKVKISCNDDRTHTLFEHGNTSLHIRAVEGKFPKYHHFIDGFEDNATLKLEVSPGDFLGALESVDYVSTVRVRIEGDDVQLSVEERESGISAATGFKAKRAERVKRDDDEEDEGDDESFATAYNLKFLKDGMSSMEGEVEFILQEPLKPALFKCGRFSYLLMPIRL